MRKERYHDLYLDQKIERYFELPEGSLVSRSLTSREYTIPRQLAVWLTHREFLKRYGVSGTNHIGDHYNFTTKTARYCIKKVNDSMIMPAYKHMVYDMQRALFGEIKFH